MRGKRKILMHCLSLGVVSGAYVLCAPYPALIAAFPAFALAVGALGSTFMAANGAEHIAQRGKLE